MSTEAFHAAMADLARVNDEIAAHLEAIERASDRPTAEDYQRLGELVDQRLGASLVAAALAGFESPREGRVVLG